MSQTLKNILLIGGGGRLGSSVLSALLSEPQFTVSVMTREFSKPTFPASVTVHQVGDNYPEAELLDVFAGQDAVISTVAITGLQHQRKFIDVAIKTGVKRFMPSDFSSDPTNDEAAKIIPALFQPKRDIITYLKSKQHQITWTSVVTGPFFELALGMGFMGISIPERSVSLIGDGDGKWSTTTIDTTALAVKNAMLKFDETANCHLYIDSFTVSQNDVVAALEKIIGSSFVKEYLDAEKMKIERQEKLSNGDFVGGAIDCIRYINGVEGHGGIYATYRKTDNELLGLPKESLETVLEGLVQSATKA